MTVEVTLGPGRGGGGRVGRREGGREGGRMGGRRRKIEAEKKERIEDNWNA